MRDFIASESCRRVILNRYMDGRTDRLACDPGGGETRCDVYSGRPSGHKRRRVLVQSGIEGSMFDKQGGDATLGHSGTVRTNTTSEDEDQDQDEDDGGGDDMQEDEQVEDQQGVKAVRPEWRLGFEIERREEEALRERRIEGLIGRREMVERLERQLEAFSNKYVICASRGKSVVDHKSWRGCQMDLETMETFTIVSQWLQKIDFEAYSGCQTCMAP